MRPNVRYMVRRAHYPVRRLHLTGSRCSGLNGRRAVDSHRAKGSCGRRVPWAIPGPGFIECQDCLVSLDRLRPAWASLSEGRITWHEHCSTQLHLAGAIIWEHYLAFAPCVLNLARYCCIESRKFPTAATRLRHNSARVLPCAARALPGALRCKAGRALLCERGDSRIIGYESRRISQGRRYLASALPGGHYLARRHNDSLIGESITPDVHYLARVTSSEHDLARPHNTSASINLEPRYLAIEISRVGVTWRVYHPGRASPAGRVTCGT